MLGSSPIYPIFAATLVAISFYLIPRNFYRTIIPVVILSVLAHAVLLFFTINVLQAWRYAQHEPFSIFGIPIFISISWGPSFALFLWALPDKHPRWLPYVFIATFSLLGVFIDMAFHALGLRPSSHWYSPWMWFFPLYLVYWISYNLFELRKKLDLN